MKVVNISKLKIGAKYTKPLYLDSENIFINAETPITEEDIDRLRKFGFNEVLTDGEEIKDMYSVSLSSDMLEVFGNTSLREIYDKYIKELPSFNKIYKKSIDIIQKCYQKIAEDKTFDINQFRTIAEDIIGFIKNSENASFNLLQRKNEGFYLYEQIFHSTVYALLIGLEMKFSYPKLVDLGIASLLADSGMTKLPASISQKNSSLNEEEFKVIKKHPLFGYQFLTKVLKIKNNLAVIALQHHESFDGTGYPQKLNKDSIDQASKIFSIADNFSAMIINRPWRKRQLPYEAMRNMLSVNMNKFDLNILRIFLNAISMYPVGSYVELSDSSLAVVLQTNKTKPLRPALMILKDSWGNSTNNSLFVDLSQESQLYITKAIDWEEENG